MVQAVVEVVLGYVLVGSVVAGDGAIGNFVGGAPGEGVVALGVAVADVVAPPAEGAVVVVGKSKWGLGVRPRG